MTESEARASLALLYSRALTFYDVSARGHTFRVIAENPIRAIQRGMEQYTLTFNAHAGSHEWTIEAVK